MKFKIVGDSLIYIDEGHNIVKGENEYDIIEVEAPHYRNGIDSMTLSFRLTATSAEDHSKSACQVLMKKEISENKILLIGSITSDFSSIIGKTFFMVTGTDSNGRTAVFDSTRPIEIRDNISLASLPGQSTAEQLFNQAQLEAQKAMDSAAETREMLDNFTLDIASETVVGGVKSGNDISVSSDGIVTINSVNGKTIGKSVPADAVFTDTVYTLPKATKNILGGVKVDGTSIISDKSGVISAVGGKNTDGKVIIPTATTDTLGGVKVDGKTITAAEDGTISALENENLQSEIANVKSSQKVISNLSVQIAHPNNFLIYDDMGKPSVMVAIPKFYLDEIIDGASHTVHPAFIINGIEQDVIYISKYQNIVENGRAYSLPMKNPAINVNYNQAYNYCKNKGAGWHLMTNAEWAAIALWCKKNGTMPKGNNKFGKDVSETVQTAIPSMVDNSNTILTATGSGPATWYHNGDFSGIADLNGNVWEWCSGMRLINNKIQIIPNNNAAVDFDETSWVEITSDGTLVPTDTTGTISYAKEYNTEPFSSISLSKEITNEAALLLESLALIPHTNSNSNDYENNIIWSSSNKRGLKRGYCYNGESRAGIFSICLYHAENDNSYRPGFRAAYYEISAKTS